jgi:hypothetical protein
MNERLIELYKSALEYAYIQAGKDATPHTLQAISSGRYAELIVLECAAYLNGAMEVHNQAEQDLCDHAARKIKEHFGVE